MMAQGDTPGNMDASCFIWKRGSSDVKLIKGWGNKEDGGRVLALCRPDDKPTFS